MMDRLLTHLKSTSHEFAKVLRKNCRKVVEGETFSVSINLSPFPSCFAQQHSQLEPKHSHKSTTFRQTNFPDYIFAQFLYKNTFNSSKAQQLRNRFQPVLSAAHRVPKYAKVVQNSELESGTKLIGSES